MNKPLYYLAILFVAFGITGHANAALIKNAGFEGLSLAEGALASGNIPGWDIAGSAGTYRPTANQFDSLPNPFNTAYLESGAKITQWVEGLFLQADTTYILQTEVGERKDNIPYPGYRVTLIAGNPQTGDVGTWKSDGTTARNKIFTLSINVRARLTGHSKPQLGGRFLTFDIWSTEGTIDTNTDSDRKEYTFVIDEDNNIIIECYGFRWNL